MIDLDALIAEARQWAPCAMSPGWQLKLITKLADALESVRAERDAALARIAELEAKHPEGWSTEDRQEAKQEAERRWSRPVSREAEQRYNAGNINGFILGAEWQKARETFISYKAIADEAMAERDAALAAIERVRAIHWNAVEWDGEKTCACGVLDCPTVAALDGAPEPEVKP